MVKIVGKGPFRPFSQEFVLVSPLKVQDLLERLSLPADLAESAIIVRNHQMLEFDELIQDDDEVMLFMAVMGG
jgi:sulfur carrier protein ThiS